MIVQDVTTHIKKPHGGPITHSSIGSKPDCPVHPLFPKLFLARGLVCNSRATVLVIYSGIRRNTYSRYSEPLSHSGSGFEQLSIRLEPIMVPSYLTLEVFHMFNSRDNLILIHGLTPDCFPQKHYVVVSCPLSFRKYDGVPEEMMTSLSWCIGIKDWRHQRKELTSSRRSVRIS